MTPLVSIMMPCYNASQSLPLALASILSQTYTTWEFILVDDGSDDNPESIIHTVDDNRIRFHRFDKNRGRGAARQQALDMAQGEYLCMLDADDWIYPNKIKRQVELLEANPDLAVLSTGMAIVDENNNIAGVRGYRTNSTQYTIYASLDKPIAPPIPFAPSMLRSKIAKKFKFDTEFKIAEDKDFLLRILLEHQFGVTSEISYVYTELESITLDKITRSLKNNRQMYSKYLTRFPLQATKSILSSYTKDFIYRGMFGMGHGDKLISNRSTAPSSIDKQKFEDAKVIVMSNYQKLFDS